MRRAAVQVSQEEKSSAAAADQASSAEAAAAGGFAGYGVAEKKAGVFALDKDVFWFAKQSKDRFRWNMLNPLPLLRQVKRLAEAAGLHLACVSVWSIPGVLVHVLSWQLLSSVTAC